VARPDPEIANLPDSVLDSWIALEVLAPQTFKRPETLAPGGDRRAVASLSEKLPWEGLGEKARPNTRLFYQVVLGTVDFGAAVERLLSVYADSRVERPSARGEAILAAVTINRNGRLVEKPAAAVSSFAWGVPRALRADLTSLATWRSEEEELTDALDEILRNSEGVKDDEDGPALDWNTILKAYGWLLDRLGLPRELTRPPSFAIRVYPSFRSSDSPEPLLLNSFFLRDLTTARTMFSEGRATANLRLYLGDQMPPQQKDLLRDQEALDTAVAPGVTPPARWPGRGRHPLVLLQQAAVNLAFKELQSGGILGINGPPGTGKTTLLRDLVAAVATARAEAMSGFDDPAKALIHSGQRIHLGQWLHLYHLDPRLKGFEMVVASSNNKAVENVSAEVPALGAVAEDEPDLRYFKTVSDVLFERETWGLCAAVLGNKENRNRFRNIFWWDKDAGLATYLLEAAGTPQVVEEIHPETKAMTTRPPYIVTVEKPPKNQNEALRRWGKARAGFLATLSRSREMLADIEGVRGLVASLPHLVREKTEAEAEVSRATEAVTQAQANVEQARSLQVEAQARWRQAESLLVDHDRHKPGLLARLFRTRGAREWVSARAPLIEVEEQTRTEASSTGQRLAREEVALKKDLARRQSAERLRIEATTKLGDVQREVQAWRERLGDRLLDESFWEREHADKQKTPPWLTDEHQRLRDAVFTAAMALHRAFIDAAARPLRHNLGALMSLLGGRALPAAEKRALIPDLWSSLFLIVPLVSTTFASVERMLRDLPPESLGWLFVDEAGQALPQAAVGAIFRTRRAVIVGDPVQIEPVVALPDRLTQAICRNFGTDPDRFNAPAASAQTLADAASPFLAEIESRHGSRRIGAPLLVHRRCSEPMFGISNAVAYEHLMVNAKREGTSAIGELLGPSRWIDVRGSAEEKWCPEEGREVLSLLQRLAHPRHTPDLYIVTPFVVVAERLRDLAEKCGLLVWTDDPRRWTRERIGTVHTVQGREADAVLFVLGAPAPTQRGARAWARPWPAPSP
jgi:hypothetical protein